MGKGFSFLNAAAIPAANTATTASAAAAPRRLLPSGHSRRLVAFLQ